MLCQHTNLQIKKDANICQALHVNAHNKEHAITFVITQYNVVSWLSESFEEGGFIVEVGGGYSTCNSSIFVQKYM